MNLQEEICYLLQQDLALAMPDTISEEVILEKLKVWVSALLQEDAERFFQIMYRLDIPEKEMVQALDDKMNAIDKLAGIIYQRQMEKAISRRNFGKADDMRDEELKW